MGLAVPAVDGKHVFYIDDVSIGQLDLEKYIVLDVPDLNPLEFFINLHTQFFNIFGPTRKTILTKHTLLLVLTLEDTPQNFPTAPTADLQKLRKNFHPDHNPEKETPTRQPNPDIHLQIPLPPIFGFSKKISGVSLHKLIGPNTPTTK